MYSLVRPGSVGCLSIKYGTSFMVSGSCIGALGWEWMSLVGEVVHCPFVLRTGCSRVGWEYHLFSRQVSGTVMVSCHTFWGICDSHLAAGVESSGCPPSRDVSIVIVLVDG